MMDRSCMTSKSWQVNYSWQIMFKKLRSADHSLTQGLLSSSLSGIFMDVFSISGHQYLLCALIFLLHCCAMAKSRWTNQSRRIMFENTRFSHCREIGRRRAESLDAYRLDSVSQIIDVSWSRWKVCNRCLMWVEYLTLATITPANSFRLLKLTLCQVFETDSDDHPANKFSRV